MTPQKRGALGSRVRGNDTPACVTPAQAGVQGSDVVRPAVQIVTPAQAGVQGSDVVRPAVQIVTPAQVGVQGGTPAGLPPRALGSRVRENAPPAHWCHPRAGGGPGLPSGSS